MLERARIAAAKKRAANPKDPLPEMEGFHMDPTNVHIMFLQQDCLFIDYWARGTAMHPVGLGQRCLLSFAGDMDPAPRRLNSFETSVTLPLLEKLSLVWCGVSAQKGTVREASGFARLKTTRTLLTRSCTAGTLRCRIACVKLSKRHVLVPDVIAFEPRYFPAVGSGLYARSS